MTNLRLALLEPEDEVLTEDTTDRGDMQDVRPLRELNNKKNNLTVKEYKCCSQSSDVDPDPQRIPVMGDLLDPDPGRKQNPQKFNRILQCID